MRLGCCLRCARSLRLIMAQEVPTHHRLSNQQAVLLAAETTAGVTYHLGAAESVLLYVPAASKALSSKQTYPGTYRALKCLSSQLACCFATATAATTDGWGFSQMQSSNSLKMSVIGGIHAVHYFRGGWAATCTAAVAAGSSSSITSRRQLQLAHSIIAVQLACSKLSVQHTVTRTY
jgi:hypothetical protein